MNSISCVLIGGESLLVGCAEHLFREGHEIAAVVTEDAAIRHWAEARELPVFERAVDLPGQVVRGTFDWLISIANLRILPDEVLALAANGAVNFHDGPLPLYAGLNTPAWAILNGEVRHGITWHMIAGGIDEGDILQQRLFEIADDETAFSLNAKCYAAALESFPEVVAQLATDTLQRHAQDLTARSYFARDRRPEGGALLDFTRPAAELARLVRGLDFGAYRNPLTCPKVMLEGGFWVIRRAKAEDAVSAAAPGTVLDATAERMRIATGGGVLAISEAVDLSGGRVDLSAAATPGARLPIPASDVAAAAAAILNRTAKAERYWAGLLSTYRQADLPFAAPAEGRADWQAIALPQAMGFAPEALAAAALALARQSCGSDDIHIGLRTGEDRGVLQELTLPWVPIAVDAEQPLEAAKGALSRQMAIAADRGGLAADLALRDPALTVLRVPDIAFAATGDAPLEGSALTLVAAPGGGEVRLCHDAARISPTLAGLLKDRLVAILAAMEAPGAAQMPLGRLAVLPMAERRLMAGWNGPDRPFDPGLTIHRAFEEQVARTPEVTALTFENENISYVQLNRRANGLARLLVDAGVKPGVNVGLCVGRGPDLLIGALAILKAGGAYVPLDPAYPAERLAHYVSDSDAAFIVAETEQMGKLPASAACVVNLHDAALSTSDGNVDGGAVGDDLAYVIYTSGSTGTPKGVMVEHRNVANFFTGMDDVVNRRDDGVWLAVTSLAFDISVLELFYTLSRGFRLVICRDDGPAAISGRPIASSGRRMDFSLYYWSNDCAAGPGKYELLLEGAKFADTNGFDALWTPERHFHAFGGPYPNPAVTGAAVAAVTKNLSVRAGSCVGPLHHPARIAEEWAVIDNLTNGKTGLAIACGWQPEDFVLRPENTPPDNKKAMAETIDHLRRLWRGEAVDYPMKSGETVPVITQPRPVSGEVALWVTTAGNPATWREAGHLGANVLTHLLGQSIEEVGEKITLYHDALREAGHDPADFTVTVMLHTLIGESRERVAEEVRGPLKEYLRSAAGLIKQYAWAFPAFKKPEGVTNPFEVDLSALDVEEMEAILDFAFERYFNDAGLFGTVEDGLARVEQLRQIGVGEVACLIDYGVPTAQVLDSLTYLADVRARANRPAELAADDHSIAAQIIRHGVSHMQCTPSMARMLTMNDEACAAIGQIGHLYLGGEALPGALVDELRRHTRARIVNMYGPTETTIWSAVHPVTGAGGARPALPIGTPIANTSAHVLDASGAPVPVGVTGELCIGGAGVTRGYWRREETTAERYVADGSSSSGDGRLYRTGDLACWRPDGVLEFRGRIDHQVKIRGQRIELGEIEVSLIRHEAVREAVVVARPAVDGDTRLAAYLTARRPVTSAELKRHLAACLPEAMVPADFVVLDTFPLTPNRKIDRKALPDPAVTTARHDDPAIASDMPGDGAQAGIAAIWARILGVRDIRSDDSFFDLGGHSLLAVQAHRELKAALELPQLSVTDIFRFPKLAALTAHVQKLRGDEGTTRAPGVDARDNLVNAETMSKRRAMRAARKRRAM